MILNRTIPLRWNSILWIPLLLACDPDSVDDPPVSTPMLAPDDGPEELQNPASHPRKQELPHQITIVDEDKLDPADPTVLQVSVPEGMEKWVFDRAAKLVETSGGDPADIVAVVAAQTLFGRIADADTTAVVTVSRVSEPNEAGLRTIGFNVSATLHGDPPTTTWTAKVRDGVCGGAAPSLDSSYLAFLRVEGPTVGLQRGSPLVLLDDRESLDLVGLEAKVPDLIAALDVTEEVAP